MKAEKAEVIQTSLKSAQQRLQPDSPIGMKIAVATLGNFHANHGSQVKPMLD